MQIVAAFKEPYQRVDEYSPMGAATVLTQYNVVL